MTVAEVSLLFPDSLLLLERCVKALASGGELILPMSSVKMLGKKSSINRFVIKGLLVVSILLVVPLVMTVIKVVSVKENWKGVTFNPDKSSLVNKGNITKEIEMTECGDEKLVGETVMDLNVINDYKILEATLSKVVNPSKGTVEMGGLFKPSTCRAKIKVAVLIPYRNRWEHLKIFLRYMHPLLQRQQLHYRIFIIEQVDEDMFNRGALLNIGFKEALKFDQFECIVLSDVDYLPVDDHNSYGCDISPKHLISNAEKYKNGIPYHSYFGGVSSFKTDDFRKINGFSNLYWGWGGEDDDLHIRVNNKGMEVHRPDKIKGHYRSITENHHRSKEIDEDKMTKFKSAKERQNFDGLNTLVYNLLDVKQEALYTHVKVKLTKEMYKFQLQQCLNLKL